MDERKTCAPHAMLPLPDMDAMARTDARITLIEPEGDYDSLRFFDQQTQNMDATLTTSLDCIYEQLRLGTVRCDRAHIRNAIVQTVGLTRLDMHEASCDQCVCASSSLGCLDVAGSALSHMRIVDCRIGYLNLRDATCRDITVSGCTIGEFDAVGATLQRVAFEDTRIDSLTLQHASCDDVDLRGARLREIRGVEWLRGTTMNLDQIADLAAAFAASIGIRTR